jgi:hypothetical protein
MVKQYRVAVIGRTGKGCASGLLEGAPAEHDQVLLRGMDLLLNASDVVL